MPNREYVIGCLKYLHDKETWKEGPLVFDDHAEDRRRITADALTLFREQEAVEPREQEETRTWIVCGNCSQHLISKWLYCPYCGRKVKWDAEASA